MLEKIYVVGDEPMCVDKAVRKALEGIDEMNILKVETLNDDVEEFLRTLPFFPSKKAVYLTVSDISEADIPGLFQNPEEFVDSVLVVKARNYDGKKAFVKELQKANLLKICDKTSVSQNLSYYVQKMAEKEGLVLSTEALNELLKREGYGVCEEVTLYTIQNDLRSLRDACGEKPSVSDVSRLVERHDVGNSFILSDMIRGNDIAGLRRQSEELRGQEIAALSALLREYRLCYKAYFFSPAECGTNFMPKKMPKALALRGIQTITNAICQFKTGALPKNQTLLYILLQLAKQADEERRRC